MLHKSRPEVLPEFLFSKCFVLDVSLKHLLETLRQEPSSNQIYSMLLQETHHTSFASHLASKAANLTQNAFDLCVMHQPCTLQATV